MRHTLTSILALTLTAAFTVAHARTQEQQQAMSPQDVLDTLMAGNERFASGHGTHRDLLKEAEETAGGQYPLAVVVSCLDSRVPVEIVFDQGIGDIFVGRVAGNVEDEDMVGSLEFATKLAGSKLILVMGHESCGAVKGAIAGAQLGNLTQLLAKIQPAIEDVKDVSGPRTVDNDEFVNAVAAANVLRTMEDIRWISPLLAEMEDNGDIMIVGAMYDLDSGKVNLLSDDHAHTHSHQDGATHSHPDDDEHHN